MGRTPGGTSSGDLGTIDGTQTLTNKTISGASNTLTNLPVASLTGTTLPSSVVSSSLTSVGTIATGTWQGTAIAATYIDSAIARLAGPTFTGTVSAPTPSAKDNSTKVATTAYVDLGDKGDLTYNTQTGTTYTFVAGDHGIANMALLNNASAITATIPTFASVPYPVGTQIQLMQYGAGQVSVAGASGVIVNYPAGLGAKTRAQYSIAVAMCVAQDTWVLSGDLTA